MSVIVMGMNIPENCGRCRFIGSCGVHGNEEWPDIESIMFNDVIGIDGKRDKDCPLRPLPEKHGRIVDVGPLDVVAYNQKGHEGESFDDGVVFMLEKMDALPTIVEAEGEE